MARTDPRPHYGTKRRLAVTGYIDLYRPAHPLARADGYVAEHRFVMHEAGVSLEGLQVHHRNGDKTDNRLENLELLTIEEHTRLHWDERRTNYCPHGHEFTEENTGAARKGGDSAALATVRSTAGEDTPAGRAAPLSEQDTRKGGHAALRAPCARQDHRPGTLRILSRPPGRRPTEGASVSVATVADLRRLHVVSKRSNVVHHPLCAQTRRIVRSPLVKIGDDPLSLRALPALEPELERHDLWQILDKLQMDLRAASAKLTEARAIIAALDLPDPKTATCPRCGIKRPGPRSLAEHMYTSHDGDLPEHWQDEAALLKDSDA